MKKIIRLKESELRNMITESVRRVIKESTDELFVADEGDGMYNVFSYDDFDKDGYYMGHNGEDGYHISDFDIVYTTNSIEDAEAWIEENQYY